MVLYSAMNSFKVMILELNNGICVKHLVCKLIGEYFLLCIYYCIILRV